MSPQMRKIWRRKQEPIDPEEAGESWDVSGGMFEGRPIITRFNAALRATAGHPGFGFQIGVALPLNTRTEDGLPTPEENQQLDEVEGHIMRSIQQSKRAVLAGVITTGDMKEFVLYTGEPDWVQGWAEELQRLVHTHEVQVMVQPDPQWTVFRDFT